mmetsp:Transcript_18697/g.17813  ORF Transcript_18697/g.17813 Transcript_18697/m.17813 type:complete len:122 (+) Transcript_18697:205-570(+)
MRTRGGGRGDHRFEDRVPYSKDDFFVQRGRGQEMRGTRGRYRGRGDDRGGRFRGDRGRGFNDFDQPRHRPHGYNEMEDDHDRDHFEAERFRGTRGHRGGGDRFRGRLRYNDFEEREFPEHF